MRVLVTGASGFIGGHLVKELLQKEWPVRVLLHKSVPLQAKECEIAAGDIRDIDALRKALPKIDILFHLAAALGASPIKKREFFQINATGTENLLRAAQEAGVKKVIHFSSAGVLGSVRKNETASEGYSPNPKNAYENSKLEGERAALRFAQEGMDIVVVRPGWVYGPADRRTFKLIRPVSRGRFFLVTRGEALQTPVYIDDLIKGVLLCLEKGRRGETYHLAGREALTVKEIVKAIAAASQKAVLHLPLPLFAVKFAAWSMEKSFILFKREAPLTSGRLAFFSRSTPLSTEKAERDLGFAPETDFEEGVIRSIVWYREHGWM